MEGYKNSRQSTTGRSTVAIQAAETIQSYQSIILPEKTTNMESDKHFRVSHDDVDDTPQSAIVEPTWTDAEEKRVVRK